MTNKTCRIFSIDFALSKWPHLHWAYLLTRVPYSFSITVSSPCLPQDSLFWRYRKVLNLDYAKFESPQSLTRFSTSLTGSSLDWVPGTHSIVNLHNVTTLDWDLQQGPCLKIRSWPFFLLYYICTQYNLGHIECYSQFSL